MLSATKELKELIEEFFKNKKSSNIAEINSFLDNEKYKKKLNNYMNTAEINKCIKKRPDIAFNELKKAFNSYIYRVMRALYGEVNKDITQEDCRDFINSLEPSEGEKIKDVYNLINPKIHTKIDARYIEELYLKLIFLIINTNI